MATFGTIKRRRKAPAHRERIARPHHYHDDPKGVVGWHNVDGWFAVRPT